MAMSKENNSILPKDIKKRIYKSRKQRPCDNCRKRKSCCIIENGIPCKLCKMFNKKCTFDKGPVYNNDNSNNRNKSKNKSMSTTVGGQLQQVTTINTVTMVNHHLPVSSYPQAYQSGESFHSIETPNTVSSNSPCTPSTFSKTSSSSSNNNSLIQVKQENGTSIGNVDTRQSSSENSGYYNDYNFVNRDDPSYAQIMNMMSSHNHDSHNHEGMVMVMPDYADGNMYGYDAEYDNAESNFENFLNNAPFDLDMNMDSLNFQANFFDFSLEYEQMR